MDLTLGAMIEIGETFQLVAKWGQGTAVRLGKQQLEQIDHGLQGRITPARPPSPVSPPCLNTTSDCRKADMKMLFSAVALTNWTDASAACIPGVNSRSNG